MRIKFNSIHLNDCVLRERVINQNNNSNTINSTATTYCDHRIASSIIEIFTLNYGKN